jgi:hypothetical protein
MGMGAPADRIAPKRPLPSILTAARDRSGDGFQLDVPAPTDDGNPADAPVRPLSQRWRTGVSFNSVNCALGGVWPRCDPGGATKAVGDVTGPYDVDVFFPYVVLECDYSRSVDEDPLNESAKQLLDARTPWFVARALWLGEGLAADADQPTLRNSAVDVTAFDPSQGGPMELDDAFAILADRFDIATQGVGEPVFHLPKRLLPTSTGGGSGNATLVRKEGNTLRAYGSDALVSPGPGYPSGPSAPGVDGFGPETNPAEPQTDYQGNDQDEAWVFISGTVEYALGEITTIPDDDTSKRRNSFAVEAIRPAIVRFDPCSVFAAKVVVPIGGVT